jgi:uncharacterized membrane protein (UPF0127 family)
VGVTVERLPRRLRGYDPIADAPGLRIHRARGFLGRLLGLAGLTALPTGSGLLLERTRSVHTFGMRFAVDLVWLREGRVVRIDRCVPPYRLRSCRAADAVLELAAGGVEAAALVPAAAVLSPGHDG